MTTCLITGANRGIGLELAKHYAKSGATVLATARDPAQATALQALTAEHRSLEILPLDVADVGSIEKLAAMLKGRAIDRLIANAGVSTGLPAGALAEDPEAVRGARVVPQVFPRISRFSYRVTTQSEFALTLNQFFPSEADSGSIDQMLADMNAPLDDEGDENALESAAADNELVKLVNKVIIDAYNQKVSDIHIEPLPGKAKTGIRFRIDGSLVPYIEVPAQFRQALVTRLKIMCDLDISERRKPQDGKIKFKKYGPLDIELRVATIPSSGGVEDVVMRILAAGEPIPLDKLGLTPHNKDRVIRTVEKPYGLFYVCGPTGSGKTTTLHSIL